MSPNFLWRTPNGAPQKLLSSFYSFTRTSRNMVSKNEVLINEIWISMKYGRFSVDSVGFPQKTYGMCGKPTEWAFRRVSAGFPWIPYVFRGKPTESTENLRNEHSVGFPQVFRGFRRFSAENVPNVSKPYRNPTETYRNPRKINGYQWKINAF